MYHHSVQRYACVKFIELLYVWNCYFYVYEQFFWAAVTRHFPQCGINTVYLILFKVQFQLHWGCYIINTAHYVSASYLQHKHIQQRTYQHESRDSYWDPREKQQREEEEETESLTTSPTPSTLSWCSYRPYCLIIIHSPTQSLHNSPDTFSAQMSPPGHKHVMTAIWKTDSEGVHFACCHILHTVFPSGDH